MMPETMPGTMLEIAIAFIKQFEGCSLSAYPDPLSGNKPITIGYGCTKKLNGEDWCLGETITQAEADSLLNYQLNHHYLPALQYSIPTWKDLNTNQEAALVSFAYNVGAWFYGADDFQTITKVLREGDFTAVPAALLLYVNPGSKVEEGLRKRRQAEGELFARPVEPARR